MRFHITILFSFLFSLLSAQSIDEIKNNPLFFWAEGTGSTMDEADKAALAELSRQISVEVHTKTTRLSETAGKEHHVIQANEVSTNSSAIFNNIEMRVVKEKPHYVVIRWISKAEIKRQEEARLLKINEMVRVGNNALKSKQISDAIRYYYWAYTLANTLPYPSTIEVEDEDAVNQKATVWLPERINGIFSKLRCSVLKKSEERANDYDLAFLYDGSPVSSIDFSYFDGTDWSPVYSAIDGKGEIELRPSYEPSQLRIKYEYVFRGEAQSDKEVAKILDSTTPAAFPKSLATVRMSASSKETKTATAAFSQLETKAKEEVKALPVDKKSFATCDNVMRKVIAAIKSRSYADVRPLFTDDGFDIFTRLINYGNAKIIGSSTLNYTSLGNSVICRSVPMTFQFSQNRTFTENVVFTFDERQKIDNISFGLGKVAQDYLLRQEGSSFTPETNQIISNFLECFKTAYALKRIDYLEQIFADDAIIITGKVLNKMVGNKESGFHNNKYVQLTKQDKATYLRNLRKSFGSKEFINIKFANNRIRHTKTKGVYGIQIKQDYFSSNYGDTGYLFLLVDVRNPKEPIIHVRAWQENPDPEWGLIGIENFDNIE